jgi:hydroxylamine reductase
MFCYQCEQTAKGVGCTTGGVCGKDARTAALQDLLVHVAKGTAMWARRARTLDPVQGADREVDVAVLEALFTTVTNVNFDPQRVADAIRRTAAARDRARALYQRLARAAGRTPDALSGPATLEPAGDLDGLVLQAEEASIARRRERPEQPAGCGPVSLSAGLPWGRCAAQGCASPLHPDRRVPPLLASGKRGAEGSPSA